MAKRQTKKAEAKAKTKTVEAPEEIDFTDEQITDEFLGTDPIGAKDASNAKFRDDMRAEAEGKENTAIECLRFLAKFGTGAKKLDIIKHAAMKCGGSGADMTDVLTEIATGSGPKLPEGTRSKIKEFLSR